VSEEGEGVREEGVGDMRELGYTPELKHICNVTKPIHEANAPKEKGGWGHALVGGGGGGGLVEQAAADRCSGKSGTWSGQGGLGVEQGVCQWCRRQQVRYGCSGSIKVLAKALLRY
jgi:hypothetical protein